MKRFVLVLSALAVSISAFAQREYARELLEQDVTRSMNLHHNYEAPEKVVDTPAPRGYKPFYISHYGRHGSRYHWTANHIDRGLSILDSLAAHDLLTEEGAAVREDLWQIKDAHKGVVGYLTHKGAEQHQGIAHRMYERCPQVFEQKDRQRVEAVSTAAQRCIQSMANFCLQLTRENPSLQFTMDAGERYAEYLSNSSGLRHVDKSRTNAILDSLITAELDPSRIMASWIKDEVAAEKYVHNPRIFIYYVFWAGSIGQCLDIEDPYIYRHFTFDEIYALWAYNDAYYYSSMCGNLENERNEDLIGRRILKDILEKADLALEEGSDKAADLRFGHDSALSPLISLLRIEGLEEAHSVAQAPDVWFGFRSMPMASNLQMIFYKNKKGDVLVKLLYNERETTIPAVQTYCSPYYKWSELREYFTSLL